MNKETKEILQRAISDVGYWKWWNQEEEKIQIKFGACSFIWWHKKRQRGKNQRYSTCLLWQCIYYFLDNDEQDGWFDETA